MKKIATLFILLCCMPAAFNAQNVGIGTETPTAMLDINGDVVFRTADLEVLDSMTLALDVNTDKFSSYRVSGADSAFVVAGVTAGMDGRVVTLINESGFAMELHHEDTMAASADRIFTGNHENLILDNMGMVTLQYDTSAMKWLVNSSNQVAQETVWDTSGSNIFFENFVGIGTEEPTSPLSIQTEVNETGFSHVAGTNAIALGSSISDVAGSIGTTTDNVFSLNAGGVGKLHVLPDGRIVIGDDGDPSSFGGNNMPSRTTHIESKLTIETPINSTGWMHVGGPDSIIVREAIGGVSAAIGTETNHTLRLMTGGIGRLHILPDGQTWIGNNNQGPLTKFTVHTLNNSNGLSQVGGDGQILSTRIGGSSASIGTHTPHIMRIVANNIAAINIDPLGNVAIGTPDPLAGYKLSVNGNVKARELVIETTGWPDYVFDTKYELRSLSQLEDFIELYHHLPNIPSAKEIEEQGLKVGDVQKKMMEKIEELTLHIIALNKRIENLENTKH